MENIQLSAEELAAEQAAVQVPKEEDLRAEIITEFGFDETVDGEKIDKLVAKQLESKKMLSRTIAQKIKHRNEADELRKKVIPPTLKSETVESGLSMKDWKAVQDIHEDDIQDVIDWAKFKQISIADAKKSDHIKTLLKEHDEQRKTAQATNTEPARRGSSQVSDEEIASKAEKGEVPEDPEELAKARWNLKKKK